MSDAQLIQEATGFIEATLGTKLQGSFGDALKDGVVLCEFLNKLKPGSVKAPKKSSMPFICMENISAYTNACKALGLADQWNFVTVDLFEGRNLRQVATNIVSLKRELGFGFEKGAKDQVDLKVAPDETTQLSSKAPKAMAKAVDCRECNRAITSGLITMTMENKVNVYYHPKCFNCKKCGVNLKSGNCHMAKQQPYCTKCILIVDPKHNISAATKDMGFKFD
eukprot:m.34815 g.34815  ORF g.34815 m.34815 type:complete len:223 (-) comp11204_c0_seq2:865-1533(-)